ncbi:uncharacterized protein PHALS_15486 [Plasmopara halstedii]|uniref:Uncharacterized protein n=1 Tax=Plasmopara halstedii TaxID=4781 RepID=A0A0P1AJ40_PLAHL|nr:uncharacterized protein PHALS_15486 [Plasmopara halstedii]CEG41102.1 hypothetical protein PHALS_15486 [Plasmopara halstedii]|eukprot:XP_024577471.1 hypothetical protein PHALS_15486 [Plasmopara halstedii]
MRCKCLCNPHLLPYAKRSNIFDTHDNGSRRRHGVSISWNHFRAIVQYHAASSKRSMETPQLIFHQL